MLSKSNQRLMASTFWWHIVKDSSSLTTNDLGWRVIPSIGRPEDRKALIKGLKNETISAIAVNAIPLDEEEMQLPPDQRIPGLSGYQVVLPTLWEELIINSGWGVEKLWQVLSFGPSRMLNIDEERLNIGSRRWLLFDPHKKWNQIFNNQKQTFCANQPWLGETILGKVVDCGLRAQESQND